MCSGFRSRTERRRRTIARILTSQEAAEVIEPGWRVGFGGLGSEPRTVFGEIVERARELPGLTLIAGMLLSDYAFLAKLPSGVRFRTWFLPPALTESSARSVDYVPLTWSQVGTLLKRDPPDAALVQIGPADPAGFHSLGVSVSYNRPLVDSARIAIAEVNLAMPRTGGDALVHSSRFDFLVPVDRPLLTLTSKPPDEVDRVIASRVATLVPENAVVQPGIGTLPNQVLRELVLQGKKGLTIFAAVTEAVRDLAEAGCVAKIVAGEVLGGEALYAWVDRNPLVEMRDLRITHDPRYLRKLSPFFAINSALEVDLFGQANVEWIAGRQIGGVGGSLDFAIGAAGDGAYILAMRSTDRSGRSRIVPRLTCPVSIPRTLVQLVVTEHGVADLRGRSDSERAQALLAIADPSHRTALGARSA